MEKRVVMNKQENKVITKKPTYWLTRFILLRFLGFIYLFAFISLYFQVIPLLGEKGLLPAENYLDNVKAHYNSDTSNIFLKIPTIFWFYISDNFMSFLVIIGIVLSLIVLCGYANSIIMFLLWFIYLSFVNIGQLWYSYGWEIQLIETGFIAIFFVPFFNLKPFPKTKPNILIIWLFRLLTFKIYLGAGLIKIRGDPCWKELTCLFYHYETQPIPNPLSPFFHYMPKLFHIFSVLVNHFIELINPFFIFLGRYFRILAGILFFGFQFTLILSGNLSFLNLLTIVPGLALFDDEFLRKILPKKLVRKAEEAENNQRRENKYKKLFIVLFFILIIYLNLPVIINLISKNQIMNTSFNNWHLANTYGAFGSVGKERYELIIQGTNDEIINENSIWKEYEFVAKPGNISKRHPIIAPYQPRIDWQIWFAAMSHPQREPWLIHFIWKLLHNDLAILKLIKENPFPEAPPKNIRIVFYKYELEKPFSENLWTRRYIGIWLNPISKETPELRKFIQANNWEDYE